MAYSTTIKQFLVDEFLPDVNESDIAEEFDLIDNGVIDSLGLLKVIAWIENQFRVSIDVNDMVPENFCSISAINAFLERVQRSSTVQACSMEPQTVRVSL
jgi:acyl carrier protein